METLLPFESIQREVVIKRESQTDESIGCPPDKRPIEQLLNFGIVNLNKPKGPTSHQVAEFVKKIVKLKKSGHGGTLDPGVTGVLPVALGKATRVVQALLPAGKEYVCIMHLHDDISEAQIRSSAEQLMGKITQLPPVKSAVVRKERQRTIYYLEIIEVNQRDVLFRAGCQAGTYIRKLCSDWGELLNTKAHMSELIRTKSGPFKLDFSITLQDLEDAFQFWKEGNDKFLRHCILPVEAAVEHLPKIWVLDSAVDSICHGASLKIPGICKLETEIKKRDLVAVLTLKDELVGLGTSTMSTEQIRGLDKGPAAKVSTVLMDTGIYQKIT